MPARPEVRGAGMASVTELTRHGAASAAGVRCYIVDRAESHGSGWTGVRDYDELRRSR